MHNIGSNIKKARIQGGLTQKEVELALNLRELTIKDYETERLKLPVDMAIELSQLYKVDLNQLVLGESYLKDNSQMRELFNVSGLFHKGEMSQMLQDPVINSWIEEYKDLLTTNSIFEILTQDLTSKQKKDLAADIIKTLGSLLGVDNKVTEHESRFFNDLIHFLDLSENEKSYSRSLTSQHFPHATRFHNRPAIKHFLLWLMFYLAKSDGRISHIEIEYIQQCAELIKVNRSNFIFIRDQFIKGKF